MLLRLERGKCLVNGVNVSLPMHKDGRHMPALEPVHRALRVGGAGHGFGQHARRVRGDIVVVLARELHVRPFHCGQR